MDMIYNHFNLVKDFNKVSEATRISDKSKMFTESKLTNFRLSLIKEEITEFSDAVNDNNQIEMVDALADTLYVIYGMYDTLNLSFDLYQNIANDIDFTDDEMEDLRKTYTDSTFNEDNSDTYYKIIADTLSGITTSNTLFEPLNEITKSSLAKCKLSNKPLRNHNFLCALADALKLHVINLTTVITNSTSYHQNIEILLNMILISVYKVARFLKFDIDKAFKIVHASNMTKFCSSEEEAKKTVEYYLSIPKNSSKYYDSPTYRKSIDGDKWIIYNKSTSKTLKNINYIPANFSSLFD
ncbi:MAG: hypothetical protein ACRCZI_08460 [Cetobacterium sp.]